MSQPPSPQEIDQVAAQAAEDAIAAIDARLDPLNIQEKTRDMLTQYTLAIIQERLSYTE